MEKVTGIGGFFFSSHDPAALAACYETHLGIGAVPGAYDQLPYSAARLFRRAKVAVAL